MYTLRRLYIKVIEYVEGGVDRLFACLESPTCRLHELVIGHPDVDQQAFLDAFKIYQKAKFAKEEGILTLLSNDGIMNQNLLPTLFTFL